VVSAETSSRSEIELQNPEESVSSSNRSSVWDRRRRRIDRKQSSQSEGEGTDKDAGGKSRSRRSNSKPKEQIEEDLDPYDSDPGESYRDHCMKMKGFSTKSCLPIPGFIQKRIARGEEETTVMTAPPSPMQSEMGDLFGPVPASLPPSMLQVRYSLRSSITDGSEKQPVGPSVMERRELRPNNVNLNVSHWSDTGGRPYMEDRYVTLSLDFFLFHECPASRLFPHTALVTFLQIRD
jgi:hypothetical protein